MAQVKRLVIEVKKTYVFEDEHLDDDVIMGLIHAMKRQALFQKKCLSLVFDKLPIEFREAEDFIVSLDDEYDYNMEEFEYKIKELSQE